MTKHTTKATHDGVVEIGDLSIPCAVLEDGTRVLSERGVTKALGGKRGGSHWRRMKQNPDGAYLPVFISANNIKPFIEEELEAALSSPLMYTTTSGTKAHGVLATTLPQICNVWLKARDADALHSSQIHIAKQADILIRGLAHVGIIALVDEATGYDKVRDHLALQAILNKYLTDEWAKWSKTFPDDFYQELFRLKGISISQPASSGKRPSYVGHWTNDIIYSRLAPGVVKELKAKNPRRPSGSRARKHHQHLTRDYGHPELKDLLSNVIFLMKGCST